MRGSAGAVSHPSAAVGPVWIDTPHFPPPPTPSQSQEYQKELERREREEKEKEREEKRREERQARDSFKVVLAKHR